MKAFSGQRVRGLKRGRDGNPFRLSSIRSLATSWCLSVWSFITLRPPFDWVSFLHRCFCLRIESWPHGSASTAVVAFQRVLSPNLLILIIAFSVPYSKLLHIHSTVELYPKTMFLFSAYSLPTHSWGMFLYDGMA